MGQLANHTGTDLREFHLGELEGVGIHDLALFRIGLAAPEQVGLREVIGERIAAPAHLGGALRGLFRVAQMRIGLASQERAAAAHAIRLIAGASLHHRLAHEAVALVAVDRAQWTVDRQLVEIGAAQARELRIQVGEQPPLQQRVIGEIQSRHQVPGVEGHLLGLREEVVRVAVQHHLAYAANRHQFFGNQLGRVKQVEAELVFVLLGHQLHAEFILGEGAVLDRLPQVAPVEVRVLAIDLEGFVPDQGVRAQHRLPVELDEGGAPFGID